MAKMRFVRFKIIVLDEMSSLIESGYQVSQDKVPPQHIHLSKPLVVDVTCTIEFQLKQIYSAPVQEFNIRLLRYHKPMNNELYQPAGAVLRNLVMLGYGVDIFPENKFHWEFTNEEDLRIELKHALVYINGYGIPWLEDPKSTVFW